MQLWVICQIIGILSTANASMSWNWQFTNSLTKDVYPVKPGVPLVFQGSFKNRVSGYYSVIITKSEIDEVAINQETPVLYIPAITGFSGCELNGKPVKYYEYKRVAFGSICALTGIQLREQNELRIKIDTDVNTYAGLWVGKPQVKTLTAAITDREINVLFQSHFPVVIAFMLFLLGLLLLRLPSSTLEFNQRVFLHSYRNILFIWSIFYLYLSGVFRQIHPVFFSRTHVTARAVTIYFSILLLLMKTNFTKKTKTIIKFVGAALIFFCLLSGALENSRSEVIITYGMALFLGILPFFLRLNRDWCDRGFLFVCIILAVGHVNDALKHFLGFASIDYSLLFLNRHTSPFFLFYSIAYIVKAFYESAEARKLIEEREHFALRLVHDLKAPILALNTFKRILKKYPLQSDEEQLFAVAQERLGDLHGRLKEFAEPAKGTVFFRDIQIVVENVINEKKTLWSTDNKIKISLHQDLPMDESAQLSVPLLRATISNLLDNACDAVGSSSDPKINVVLKAEGKHLVFSLEDNGPGVAIENREKIFEKGFSTKSTSGLGLYFIRKELAQVGATIEFDSSYAQGARFIVKFQKA